MGEFPLGRWSVSRQRNNAFWVHRFTAEDRCFVTSSRIVDKPLKRVKTPALWRSASCLSAGLEMSWQGRDRTRVLLHLHLSLSPPLMPLLFCFLWLFLSLWPFQLFHSINSPDNSAFSLCSSGLVSALLVLSTICLYESLSQPWYNPLWLTGLKAPTN